MILFQLISNLWSKQEIYYYIYVISFLLRRKRNHNRLRIHNIHSQLVYFLPFIISIFTSFSVSLSCPFLVSYMAFCKFLTHRRLHHGSKLNRKRSEKFWCVKRSLRSKRNYFSLSLSRSTSDRCTVTYRDLDKASIRQPHHPLTAYEKLLNERNQRVWR